MIKHKCCAWLCYRHTKHKSAKWCQQDPFKVFTTIKILKFAESDQHISAILQLTLNCVGHHTSGAGNSQSQHKCYVLVWQEFCFCLEKRNPINICAKEEGERKKIGWYVTIASQPQASVFVWWARREETNFRQRWNRMAGVRWTKPVWEALRYWLAAGYQGRQRTFPSRQGEGKKKIPQRQHFPTDYKQMGRVAQ